MSNTLINLPDDKKARRGEAQKPIAGSPELLGRLCSEVLKIGMPSYYPAYMILHGMRAIAGNPNEGALIKDFVATGTWKKIQAAYLSCPT